MFDESSRVRRFLSAAMPVTPPQNLRSSLALRRSPLLLLAAAFAVMAVLLVDHAPPASADHGRGKKELDATLYVRQIGAPLGCQNHASQGSRCSETSTLSDDDFTYSGQNYAITQIVLGSRFSVVFNKAIPAAIRSSQSSWGLLVEGRRFRLADASFTVSNTTASWNKGDLNWWNGKRVRVSVEGDPYWSGVDIYGSSVQHTSDGQQNVTIPSDNSARSFNVRLDQAPTANVTIKFVTANSGYDGHDDRDAATVSPKTLTFTPSNWNTGQTVTVTAVPDADNVHEHLLVLANVSIASSADSNDRYRSPDSVNGVYVTIWDGADRGTNHGGL
jgi:hypothetical protein